MCFHSLGLGRKLTVFYDCKVLEYTLQNADHVMVRCDIDYPISLPSV